jgi:hypothetical protein
LVEVESPGYGFIDRGSRCHEIRVGPHAEPSVDMRNPLLGRVSMTKGWPTDVREGLVDCQTRDFSKAGKIVMGVHVSD